MEYDTRLSVYVLLTDAQGNILLTWFKGGTHYEPCWTLPGGGVKFYESLREAAIRETYEETGYHVSVGRVLADWHHTVPSTPGCKPFRSQRLLYDGVITGGVLGTTEIDGSTEFALWMPIAEVPGLDSRAAIVDVALEVLSAGEEPWVALA